MSFSCARGYTLALPSGRLALAAPSIGLVGQHLPPRCFAWIGIVMRLRRAECAHRIAVAIAGTALGLADNVGESTLHLLVAPILGESAKLLVDHLPANVLDRLAVDLDPIAQHAARLIADHHAQLQ